MREIQHSQVVLARVFGYPMILAGIGGSDLEPGMIRIFILNEELRWKGKTDEARMSFAGNDSLEGAYLEDHRS